MNRIRIIKTDYIHSFGGGWVVLAAALHKETFWKYEVQRTKERIVRKGKFEWVR